MDDTVGEQQNFQLEEEKFSSQGLSQDKIAAGEFSNSGISPTPDPDFVEISLEDYLEALEKGVIFLPESMTPLEAEEAFQAEQRLDGKGEYGVSATTGWVQTSGGWKYMEDGVYVVNDWRFINSNWYYFNYAGYAVTGWHKIDGEWYYFRTLAEGTECSMVKGWFEKNDLWYYFDSSGVMYHGDLFTIAEKIYYFNPASSTGASGYMQHGRTTLSGLTYYFGLPNNSDTGAMYKSGWLIDREGDSEWYYFDTTYGYMRLGWLELEGELYHLSMEDGHMLTASYSCGEYLTARFDPDGVFLDWDFKYTAYPASLPAAQRVRVQNARFEKGVVYTIGNCGYMRTALTTDMSVFCNGNSSWSTIPNAILSEFSFLTTNYAVKLEENQSSGNPDIAYAIDDLTTISGFEYAHLLGYTFKQTSDETWNRLPPDVVGIAVGEDNAANDELIMSMVYISEEIDQYDEILQVALHETGHAIGLRHTYIVGYEDEEPGYGQDSLMYPDNTSVHYKSTLQDWDKEQISLKYPVTIPN